MRNSLQMTEHTEEVFPLAELLKEILNLHVEPEDPYEIAAILESIGLNDTRVRDRYGFYTVFDLAMELWDMNHRNVTLSAKAKPESKHLLYVLLDDLRQFLRGSIFALPMVISIVSMLILKFSLWSYVNLPIQYGTAIAIGTFLSFATVGGFMQAIARKSYSYVILGYYQMARKVTFQLIRYGIVMSILITLLILTLNVITNILTPFMLFLTLSYYLVMNSIWLAVTAMYILRKELIFTGLITLGIGFVYISFVWLKINIIVSQLLSMFILSLISIWIVWILFKRLERSEDPGTHSQPGKTSISMYSVFPYFVYGSAYFIFLFFDRIMAWSTNESFMPYFIWFRSKYELGLDFALMMMVIPMGVAEVVVTRLMRRIEWGQKNYQLSEIRLMRNTFKRSYFQLYGTMSTISVLSAIGVSFVVYWLSYHLSAADGKLVFAEIRNYIVFFIALISYAIISVSLLNTVIMFSLSEPKFALQAVLKALAADAFSGFLLSRWLGSDFAVLGLLIGSLVFLWLTTSAVQKVINQLDYYLYQMS